MFVEWGEAADRPASPKGRERPRLCENAPSRDLLRIFFLGRALTMMSEDFLAAVSPKSRPKFYFEKERPSFHTAWTRDRSRGSSADGLLTLMSFVKHREHDWNVLHAHQREVD